MSPVAFKRVVLRWAPFTGVAQRGGNRALGVSQRDSVLRPLWACNAGDDTSEVETDYVVVLRNLSIWGAEQALTPALGFN